MKKYEFTEDELMTLRNALIEYWQFLKNLNPQSPIAIKNKDNALRLKDQFKNDYERMR